MKDRIRSHRFAVRARAISGTSWGMVRGRAEILTLKGSQPTQQDTWEFALAKNTQRTEHLTKSILLTIARLELH
jgi:hypothetical protein